jgi:hypothetical protein
LLCLITADYVRTAFSMTGRAIKIDKRLPCFIGGWAGDIKSARLRAQAAEDLSFKTGAPFGKLRINSHADDPLLFSFDFFNKRSGIHNVDAVVVLEIAKVRITRDNVIRLFFQGTGQKLVIGRIIGYFIGLINIL